MSVDYAKFITDRGERQARGEHYPGCACNVLGSLGILPMDEWRTVYRLWVRKGESSFLLDPSKDQRGRYFFCRCQVAKKGGPKAEFLVSPETLKRERGINYHPKQKRYKKRRKNSPKRENRERIQEPTPMPGFEDPPSPPLPDPPPYPGAPEPLPEPTAWQLKVRELRDGRSCLLLDRTHTSGIGQPEGVFASAYAADQYAMMNPNGTPIIYLLRGDSRDVDKLNFETRGIARAVEIDGFPGRIIVELTKRPND